VGAHVARPLAALTDAAEALADGDYGRRVSVNRRDEIGSLVASLNRMAAQIETSRTTLETQSGELEHQFHQAQDLAQELEVSNQELMESMEEAVVARRNSTIAASLLDEVMGRAPVGIGVLDMDLRFVRVNPALAAIHGMPERVLLGRSLSEVMPSASDAEARLRSVVATGETIVGHKISIMLHGAPMHCLTSYFPVRGPEDLVTGVAVIVVDTTAQDALESQLLQAQKMEAVGRLAGGVAHDFNNLLTVITSYSAMAVEDLAPEDPLRADMSEVLGAANRATALTQQLLAFSRNQMLQPSILNLNEVGEGMRRMLTRLIGEDITLTLDLAAGLGEVSADRGQIEQVIMNLAINSRDAMPDGGGLVVSTSNATRAADPSRTGISSQAGEFVTLTVTDTGTGMSNETLAHLFEPFFTTKPVGKGTGLGLATVYGIVKQSGGDIQVRSAPGAGTSFTISLPRVYAPGAPVQPRAALPPESHRGTETVLLVEDDIPLRQLALRVLRGAGFTVLEAGNAAEAERIGAAEEGHIHLLLTDVVMPGSNGRVLAERLALRRPELRVLYMSGYTDDEVMRRGVSAANSAFLQKPFTPGSLLTAVSTVLSEPALADAGPTRQVD
jgi:two-component system, cell cycle sensor histidine kinase and response regulator CckA